MAKLKSKERIKDLELMIKNSKLVGLKVPRIELEYNKTLKKLSKGNKTLFNFK